MEIESANAVDKWDGEIQYKDRNMEAGAAIERLVDCEKAIWSALSSISLFPIFDEY